MIAKHWRQEFIVGKRSMWAVFRLMLLVYTTCMAMSGNGVQILGMKIMKVRLLMAAFGNLAEIIHPGCCGAAAGATIPGFVAAPTASAMGRASGSTSTVCVWRAFSR